MYSYYSFLKTEGSFTVNNVVINTTATTTGGMPIRSLLFLDLTDVFPADIMYLSEGASWEAVGPVVLQNMNGLISCKQYSLLLLLLSSLLSPLSSLLSPLSSLLSFVLK